MNVHVDILFAWGGRVYRPGAACVPDEAAKWAIAQGYARPNAPAAPETAPENKAHAAAPKRAVRKSAECEARSAEQHTHSAPRTTHSRTK